MSTDLHPDFPVVTGDYVLTQGWRVALPEQFNRRIEDGSLVLWRPELTFWINVWHGEGQVKVDAVLERLLADASAARSEENIERSGAIARLSYELAEDDAERSDSGGRSVNAFVIAPTGYVQLSAYYDSPEARALAHDVIASLRADPV
ncbi:hypothetical protein [Massilia sp. TSP1-1-2]|uniref:hypothetical protein n=1 Tax=unclassified Massilia TaxID=2609279 RepID=UPI003CF69A27